ncbi:hypothetical protein HZZ13_19360 [Bradyrhizobium sp. CNPSo 4010]|uniref:Uncharacterized protein n=1 Tax=Bradyrhizobium agreste TaxID=2751811 RepID=A0ABS0PRW7_9BRAD|nr:hypothetical protein [Bradyrhizobium agreste]MBH5399929.1 hypothetical protein [Bradyrhizobium agreste]
MGRNSRKLQRAYVVPYGRLKELLSFDGRRDLVLAPEQVLNAIKLLLRGVEVDETWYLNEYADVKEAVNQGAFRSARHHFIENGYFEERRPFPVVVDDDWYGRAYPDVAEGVEFGEISSFQEHFEMYGEREGRFPSED